MRRLRTKPRWTGGTDNTSPNRHARILISFCTVETDAVRRSRLRDPVLFWLRADGARLRCGGDGPRQRLRFSSLSAVCCAVGVFGTYGTRNKDPCIHPVRRLENFENRQAHGPGTREDHEAADRGSPVKSGPATPVRGPVLGTCSCQSQMKRIGRTLQPCPFIVPSWALRVRHSFAAQSFARCIFMHSYCSVPIACPLEIWQPRDQRRGLERAAVPWWLVRGDGTLEWM